MRLTLCTLFNMNYHFVNTYYYCVHFSNYIVLFLCVCHFCIGMHTCTWVAPGTSTCTLFIARTCGVCLCDGCVLMRSNKDGNDSVSLLLFRLKQSPLFTVSQ